MTVNFMRNFVIAAASCFIPFTAVSAKTEPAVSSAHDSYTIVDTVQEYRKNHPIEAVNTVEAPVQEAVESAEVSYSYSVPCFLQRGQWYSGYTYGGLTIGDSGCGVCTIAMAVSAIYGYDVYPSDVASVLYDAGSYNHPEKGYGNGTLGQARYDAAAYYGVGCDGVYDYDTFVYDLEHGMVISQMCGPHTLYNVSHGIAVYSAGNGMVQVNDPWGTYTGTYSIDKVWGWHSTDPSDMDAGATVFAFHG